MTHRFPRLLNHALLLLGLFLAAWLPRAVALDAFVTADEHDWLTYSANFYRALGRSDLAGTFQVEHPGVTLMAAGALSFWQHVPGFAAEVDGPMSRERAELETWLADHTEVSPLDLLVTARRWIVLAISLMTVLCFPPLRRLLGPWLGALAFLAVAWDPYYVALSRQLQPDGMLTSLVLLSLLSFIAWLYAGRQRVNLAVSGVAAGLAMLTKAPSVFLVLTVVLLAATSWFVETRRGDRSAGRSVWVGLLAWGAIAGLVGLLLWPALWVQPVGTVQRMLAGLSNQSDGHVNANFFLGKITQDPGLFFYPIAFLWRTTPFVLIGLASTLVLVATRRPPGDASQVRHTLFALATFVLVFWLGMAASAKQFDRYFLPAMLALDVISAVGWGGIALLLAQRLRRPAMAYGLVAVALLLHGALGLRHFPYYLTYYNPLVGGAATAPRVLMVGWGEGLDAAAAWLNAQPDAEELRVVSWYDTGPFSYFFRGEAGRWSYHAPQAWLDTDFIVLYINQMQRAIPDAKTLADITQHAPVHVVRSHGLELARIYDTRTTLLPDFVEIDDAQVRDFGAQIRLAAIDLDTRQVDPGQRLPVTFHLQSLAPIASNYNMLAQLVGPDGATLWHEEGWPWGAPTDQWPVRAVRSDRREIAIPADARPGLYKLTLAFYDPGTLDRLPVTPPNSTAGIAGDAADVALIRVGDAEPPGPVATPWSFGDALSLTGVDLPQSVDKGAALPLTLVWESAKHTPQDYTVFVHVLGPDGTLVAQQDRPPLAGFAPTSVWRPGDLIVDDYAVPLPENLPAGSYTVNVGLYDASGARLPLSQGGQDVATVGTFVVGQEQ